MLSGLAEFYVVSFCSPLDMFSMSETDQKCTLVLSLVSEGPLSTFEQYLGMLSVSTLRLARNEPDLAFPVQNGLCQSESTMVVI